MGPHARDRPVLPLLGVDVGGTFTDAVLVVADRIFSAKRLSTEPQAAGVLTATRAVLAAAGVEPRHVARFVHGMTVATNALLERRGARVVLVTTEGFRDVLAIARQDRAELYTLYPTRRPPLVPRDRCVTALERVGPDGVELPLASDEVARVVAEVRRLEPEAVAVCLLWSFLVGDHEQALGRALREALPGIQVVTSVETAPVFREYERMSTTVVDAYVSPGTAGYLREIASDCRAAGLVMPEIMQSSGGTTDLETAAAHAVRLLLSGPAGGAVAARLLGLRQGFRTVLSFDMGGTSTDCAALVEESAEATWRGPGTATERAITGLPLRTPMVDVHTVSAGGGSIARVDVGGALKVGPASAGARPGPACYGLGGLEATVTDALVVLGRIPAGGALAGTLLLDRRLAVDAVARLGDRVGLAAEETAEGVVRVATANMAAALRAVTLERGLDPRGFLLVAFGGAGGLHACDLADELGMGRVLMPSRAGVLSALGLCVAPRRADRTHSLLRPAASVGPAEWDGLWADLERSLVADLPPSVAGSGPPMWVREVEARYRGQSHELTVVLDRDQGPESVAAGFHRAHQRWFGYQDDEAEIELVAVRAVVVFAESPELPRDAAPGAALQGESQVYLAGRSEDCAVWRISPGAEPAQAIVGPALLTEDEFCGFVAPGWAAESVPDGFLLSRAAAPVGRPAGAGAA